MSLSESIYCNLCFYRIIQNIICETNPQTPLFQAMKINGKSYISFGQAFSIRYITKTYEAVWSYHHLKNDGKWRYLLLVFCAIFGRRNRKVLRVLDF